MLSIIFPSDPQKPDLISVIKSIGRKSNNHPETARNNRITNMLRIDGSGYALVWSPDEKYLYYVKENNSEKEGIFEEIWISDADGNRHKIYSKFKFHNTRDAKWSPDGTKLSFISNLEQNKSGIFIYDTSDNTIEDITPVNVLDAGVLSFGWDTESLRLVVSVDVVNPYIDIYNINTKKYSRLDMKLLSCKNVDFLNDGKIVFSNRDENFKYSIFTADSSGKNIEFLTEGQEFLLSPDRQKLAILSDVDMQRGLWIYDINTKDKRLLSNWSVYDIYWLSNSTSLFFSMEEDSKSKFTFKGTIYKFDSEMKTSEITGAIHTIFVASKNGSRLAMTSPEFMEDGKENKGVFIGEVN